MSFQYSDIPTIKKIIIKTLLLKEKCALLSIENCKLFSAKTKTNYFIYSDIEGALTLIYNTIKKCFKFRIYSLSTFDILIEINLSDKFNAFYYKIKPTFHYLRISDGYFGFLFPDMSNGDKFLSRIENIKKETKENIEKNFTQSIKIKRTPTNFDNLNKKLLSSYNIETPPSLIEKINFDILPLCDLMNNFVYNEITKRFEYYGSMQFAIEQFNKYNINLEEIDIIGSGSIEIGDYKYFSAMMANHIVNDVGLKEIRHFEKKSMLSSVTLLKKSSLKSKQEEEEEIDIKKVHEEAQSLRKTLLNATIKSSNLGTIGRGTTENNLRLSYLNQNTFKEQLIKEYERKKDSVHIERNKDSVHLERNKDSVHLERNKDSVHVERKNENAHAERKKDNSIHMEKNADNISNVTNVLSPKKDEKQIDLSSIMKHKLLHQKEEIDNKANENKIQSAKNIINMNLENIDEIKGAEVSQSNIFNKLGVKREGKFDFSQFDKPKSKKEDKLDLQNLIKNLKKIDK